MFCPSSLDLLHEIREALHLQVQTRTQPLLVGVGGPGGSGKSQLTRWLAEQFPGSAVLSLDEFRLPRDQRPAHAPFGSHPDANDFELLFQVLEEAKQGRPLRQPVFDRQAGRVLSEVLLPPSNLILVDGEISAYAALRDRLEVRILLKAHSWTLWRSRWHRDRRERDCSSWKTLKIFTRSTLMDYPRFSRGADQEAHYVLYRDSRNRLRRLN
ncbi:MAG: uridine kinase family protein [Kiritimatiellia bacterium]